MKDLFERLEPEDIRSIFEAFPKPMLMLAGKQGSGPEPEFYIAGVNREYLTTSGETRDAVVGKEFTTSFPASCFPSTGNTELIKEAFMRLQASETAENLENLCYRHRHPSVPGKPAVYWNLQLKPIMGGGQNLRYILCFPENVTELVELRQKGSMAEVELELQQHRLFSAFMQAPFAIAILQGEDHIVRLANAKICSIWGRDMDEVLGKTYFSVTPGYDRQGFKERMDGVLHSGKAWSGKEIPVYFNEEGHRQTRYFNSLYEPFRDQLGQVQGVIVISVEVSEEVNFRNKITESESRLNLALEATRLGAWELNHASMQSTGSLRYDEILGEKTKRETWTKEDRRERLHAEDRNATLASFDAAWLHGELKVQCRVIWPDGSVHWVEMLGRVQYDAAGLPERMLGTAADITGSKKNEQLKDEFTGIVSHELRTPVTSLKAYCEFLEESFSRQGHMEASRMLGKMDAQIDKLTRLIADLLDKTKIEEGKMKLIPEHFSFNDLVLEIIEDTHRLSARHHIRFEVADEFFVFADRERTGQVLTNYLTNAIKYSPLGGEVLVKIFKLGVEMVCSVQDFGIGIPSDKTNLVFSRFFRVQGHNSETYPGLGLGLYISSELIARQGGRCWVSSEEGSGSIFYFSIPLDHTSVALLD